MRTTSVSVASALLATAFLGLGSTQRPGVHAWQSLVTPCQSVANPRWRAPSLPTRRPRSIVRVSAHDGDVDERGGAAPAVVPPVRLLVLMTVPVVWGTYAPAVRFLYEQPQPIPGLLFSTLYYVVALVSLSVASALTTVASNGDEALPTQAQPVARAGAELGGYLFLGNVAQVLGLQFTTADRAAFLVQLTTIMVPVFEGLVQRRALPLKTWAACAIATVGVAVLSSEGLGQTSSLKGDALVTLSAVFYTFHVLRLGDIAPQTAPLKLALSKASWETAYSFLSVAALLALASLTRAGTEFPLADSAVGSGLVRAASEVETFLASVPTLPIQENRAILAAGAWCGAVTCAYTIWAQSFGQRDVRPANANLIYTTQPIFSAVFAAALLDEKLSAQGWVGGAIIGGALLVSLLGDEDAPPDPPHDDGPGQGKDQTLAPANLVQAS